MLTLHQAIHIAPLTQPLNAVDHILDYSLSYFITLRPAAQRLLNSHFQDVFDFIFLGFVSSICLNYMMDKPLCIGREKE